MTAERLHIYRDFWRYARSQGRTHEARAFAKIYWHGRLAYKAALAVLESE